MKKSKIFLSTLCFALCTLCLLPFAQADAPLSGTAGDNLTAFNGGVGAMNNNNWNQLMNERTPPAADFGNCNALVMRCAQPKCATGGCISMDITYPIVQGCVMSNTVCKKHGDALIQSISAQLVANSTAKANAANASAQQAAAQQAASQSAEQMQQMQTQMQELQNKITEQNTQTAASIQAALDEQKQLAAAQAAAKPEVAQNSDVQTAVNAGVSADVLARDQASGQILSKLENAENSLAALKKTMQNTFDYAGCDSSGNNCTGPKRVKAFKQKAGEFFEPYENSLDEVYDALIIAQSLGVDITDIYMMLNGSCNVWGKYLCKNGTDMRYDSTTCPAKEEGGKIIPSVSASTTGRNVLGGRPCKIGDVVPLNDGGCQLLQMLNNQEEVQQNWLYPEEGTGTSKIQIGCASEALDNSLLFRGRKKQATIDIEVLQRIINQDPTLILGENETADKKLTKYCSDNNSVTDLQNLQQLVSLKKLPGIVCIESLKTTGITGSKNGCDDENNIYINPLVAICTVHSYNIGSGTNPDTPVDKQNMNNIIALKSTIITQQMKRQYDYLETTMKRFKIQLEKSILTSKMEAAGAASTTNVASSSSSTGMSGAQDCAFRGSPPDVITCLQSNLGIINSAFNNKDYSINVRRQIEKDVTTAINFSGNVCTTTPVPGYCAYLNTNCKDAAKIPGGANGTMKTCIDNLNTLLATASYDYSVKSRLQSK